MRALLVKARMITCRDAVAILAASWYLLSHTFPSASCIAGSVQFSPVTSRILGAWILGLGRML